MGVCLCSPSYGFSSEITALLDLVVKNLMTSLVNDIVS